MSSSILRALVALALATGLTAPASAADPDRTEPWPEDVLALAESLPVQDGGRVKPLSTYAAFTLLRLNGKRSLETPSGERLGPTEWLLDVLFFPRDASAYECFLVQNDEVVEALGIEHDGKDRRDRYTFDALRPGIDRMFELANEYSRVEASRRSPMQQQTIDLATNIQSFMHLAGHLDHARARLIVGEGPALEELFGGREEVGFHDVVETASALAQLYRELGADPATAESDERREVAGLFRSAASLASSGDALALFPPTTPREEDEEWLTPEDVLAGSLDSGGVPPEHTRILAAFERMVEHQGDDPAAFRDALADAHAAAVGLAEPRGEYDKIELEVTYYKAKLLTWSLALFVLAFLSAAFLWLKPRSRLLYGLSNAAALGGALAVSAAIVMRCIIRGRPPVSTLYETVLFVTATGTLVALAIELIGRRRIAVSAAAILGVVGVFIANGYEVLDKQDTMPSLVAVLDTNFWLATHVTTITIGYSAGMLAALLASIYLLTKALGLKRGDREFFRSLGKMVYGVVCFALIFSLVGTILGGIWANDSWGRFWGWDPKENGALLICLSQIAILHGRMGGYLREHGVCMAAAFGGTVVAFSWWGVNLLGVGLHSYGFTSGIHSALWTYYGLQWGVVGLGALAAWRERSLAREPARAEAGGRDIERTSGATS